MKLFDYIFYRITEFYSTISKDISDLIIGPTIVSIIQMLNILSILLILSLFNRNIFLLFDKEYFNSTKTILLIPLTVLFAYNIYRYSKINDFDKLKNKWGNDNINIRKRKTWIIIIYIILSLFFFVYLLSIRVKSL
jgi:hypothetical protein